MDKLTTEFFWDCNCEKNHIKPRRQKTCRICKATRDESPDSRIKEVAETFKKGINPDFLSKGFEVMTTDYQRARIADNKTGIIRDVSLYKLNPRHMGSTYVWKLMVAFFEGEDFPIVLDEKQKKRKDMVTAIGF